MSCPSSIQSCTEIPRPWKEPASRHCRCLFEEKKLEGLSYGLDCVTVEHGAIREHYISARRTGPDQFEILRDFPAGQASILAQYVFGGCGFHDRAATLIGDKRWPVTWLQGDICSGEHLSGMQAFAVSGVSVSPVVTDGRVVGTSYSDADADYCHLGGLLPENPDLPRAAQARSWFERAESALHGVGMDFSNVIRTWLFLDSLLEWYGDFNAARTVFFNERKVFDRLVPASTGIGARNPYGAAITGGVLAIKPRNPAVRVEEIASPLQGSALDYRSSFSRALEVGFPDRRHLYISGTASIDSEGRSIFTGDVVGQIERTLDVIEAILESRSMGWEHASRAITYLRNMQDVPAFESCCRRRGMPALPLIFAHATVCRDDLLVEVELDAVSTGAKTDSHVMI